MLLSIEIIAFLVSLQAK